LFGVNNSFTLDLGNAQREGNTSAAEIRTEQYDTCEVDGDRDMMHGAKMLDYERDIDKTD
jgi:hypothetical protein